MKFLLLRNFASLFLYLSHRPVLALTSGTTFTTFVIISAQKIRPPHGDGILRSLHHVFPRAREVIKLRTEDLRACTYVNGVRSSHVGIPIPRSEITFIAVHRDSHRRSRERGSNLRFARSSRFLSASPIGEFEPCSRSSGRYLSSSGRFLPIEGKGRQHRKLGKTFP